MTRPNLTEEFKIDAIKQITERGYSVAAIWDRTFQRQCWLCKPLTSLSVAQHLVIWAQCSHLMNKQSI